MIVDQKGHFMTQRHHPRMIGIHAHYEQKSESISLQFNDQKITVYKPSPLNPTSSVTVWTDECQAHTSTSSVNLTLSQWLNHPVRLVYMSDEHVRQVDPEYARPDDEVSFADGFPILLTSEASLRDLNQHLKPPIEMERFRANIIVADTQPYAEDQWKQLRINGVIFDLVKPCARCVIPSINLTTARKEAYVLEVLTQHRRINRKVIFGQNLIHRSQGLISVGDQVDILA